MRVVARHPAASEFARNSVTKSSNVASSSISSNVVKARIVSIVDVFPVPVRPSIMAMPMCTSGYFGQLATATLVISAPLRPRFMNTPSELAC